MFAYPPHKYITEPDGYFNYMVDLACACAHWEDENQKTKESEDLAKDQSGSIGGVVSEYQKSLDNR